VFFLLQDGQLISPLGDLLNDTVVILIASALSKWTGKIQ